MNKNERPQKQGGLLILLAVLASVIAAMIIFRSDDPGRTGPVATDPTKTEPVTQAAQTEPMQTEPVTQPMETEPVTQPMETEPVQTETQAALDTRDFNLGYGLEITDSGKYTGIYMEDGSDEVLADVMMIIVKNNGQQDVQLARITAICGGEEYHFTLTDLPVGTQVVVLEQERRSSAQLTSAVMDTCALFPEPVTRYEDLIRISGSAGVLNVQNISDSDLEGDVYVYYKYAGQDLYYGGITFRIRVEGGLKAGELRQITSSHYDPEGCAVVRVTIHE